MSTTDFMQVAAADHVRIRLNDGQEFTGHFRTDILTPSALSAYFYGDQRDLSLPIEAVAAVEPI